MTIKIFVLFKKNDDIILLKFSIKNYIRIIIKTFFFQLFIVFIVYSTFILYMSVFFVININLI